MSIDQTHYRTPVLRTPFHARTSALCQSNEWSRWAGYTTPERYTEVEHEYFAVRNRASLFDLTPMIKYAITGPDAQRYLNRVLTRNVARLGRGRVVYCVWCNDRGHVLDDGTLFRLNETEFRLCSQDRHLDWLLDSAYGYDVQVEDVTERIAALALQGPTSCAVLKGLELPDIEMLRPFRFAELDFDGCALTVSRTGYTGDLGYELWIDPAWAEALWDRLMEAGAVYHIRPIGSKALNLVRIEAGLLLPHVDFMPANEALRPTRGRSPFELGLDWLVDFDKGHFTGRRALLEERRTGSRYRVARVDVEGNRPAQDAFIYHDKKREAGHVTSAMWSPTCKRSIAIATLRTPYLARADRLWAEIYVPKELKWEKRMVRCRIVDGPFFNPPRRWATPAGDV
ncbi:MAG: aminomethyl transferase family protein [Gammaproteobacteria bacterium]|nr:aminomethyl transferase family protein [Gammaproteobacteria bacterium]NIR83890.1 aminomethyl transferase family protein [Gammaproteobacteria bacterium]NIR90669.1 aminomethyl transferase family protein [Gammaproteobacteria bacterium]NIV76058.1 aminomethyl transferase family protein [Gammaproteobacteria bacterium]